MTSWKPTPREPAKTKAELREMLAEAVRNTAQPEIKGSAQGQEGSRLTLTQAASVEGDEVSDEKASYLN